MKMFTISLNPTYYCNFAKGNCAKTCYLGPLLSDKKRLDLTQLDKLLTEIKAYTAIDFIDLYGGEIGVLDDDYFYQLKDVIRKHYQEELNIITNLSMIRNYFLDEDVELSVSWDYKCRQLWKRVLSNIRMVDKQISILMLATDELIKYDPNEIITLLNSCRNIISVEIKPYSNNQYNTQQLTFKDYEDYIKKWIENKTKKDFEFVNEINIRESLTKKRNSFSNDHIYIQPSGKLAVLDFDQNDNEYFLELDSFDDYLKWCQQEHKKVTQNKYCRQCNYLGHCLSEHLRDVQTLSNSCNGFKHLLDWYETT